MGKDDHHEHVRKRASSTRNFFSQPGRDLDDGMSVAGWTRLLQSAGFALTDVLLRDADQVIIASLKS